VARTFNDMLEVAAVRTLVYMGEQICPFHEEFDGNDFAGATHIFLRKGHEPVGVIRMRWFADFAKLERMALRREHRGGRAIMMLINEAVRIAERKGYRQILGHAQRRLAPFWRRYFNGVVRDDRPPFHFSDHSYVEILAEIRPPADALTLEADPLVLVRPEGDWDQPGVLDSSAQRPHLA
jgi:predicted GNAT family N-acyltransferase